MNRQKEEEQVPRMLSLPFRTAIYVISAKDERKSFVAFAATLFVDSRHMPVRLTLLVRALAAQKQNHILCHRSDQFMRKTHNRLVIHRQCEHFRTHEKTTSTTFEFQSHYWDSVEIHESQEKIYEGANSM